MLVTFSLQGLILVSGILVARLLGPEGRGLVALVFAVGTFTSQLTFGSSLPNAIAKNLSETQAPARDGLRGLTGRVALLSLAPAVVAGVIVYVIQRGNGSSVVAVLAVAAAVITMQTIAARVLAGGLQGERRLIRMGFAGLVPQLLFTLSLAVGFVLDVDWTATSVLVAYVVAGLLGMLFAFAMMLPPTGRRSSRLDERELWAESRRNFVSSARPLDGIQIDRIVVAGLIGPVALGIYAAGIAVASLCSLVSNAVSVIVLPKVAVLTGDLPAQRAVARRWTGVSILLVVAIVAALQLVVAPVITLAFGEQFEAAIGPARWLIVADGLMALRKVLIAILQGLGRSGRASTIELAVLPLLVAGLVVAALLGSLVGIGVSLTVAGLLSCVLLGLAARRALRGSAVSS